jgi:hypothetical protein
MAPHLGASGGAISSPLFKILIILAVNVPWNNNFLLARPHFWNLSSSPARDTLKTASTDAESATPKIKIINV